MQPVNFTDRMITYTYLPYGWSCNTEATNLSLSLSCFSLSPSLSLFQWKKEIKVLFSKNGGNLLPFYNNLLIFIGISVSVACLFFFSFFPPSFLFLGSLYLLIGQFKNSYLLLPKGNWCIFFFKMQSSDSNVRTLVKITIVCINLKVFWNGI